MFRPHRMVGNLLDQAATGAKSAGESIQRILDAPPAKVGIRPAPNRIPDSLLDAEVDSLMTLGGGIQDALDQPLEVISSIGRRRF